MPGVHKPVDMNEYHRALFLIVLILSSANQFGSVDDLKGFCLAAYAIADYDFTRFKVVSFGKMPPVRPC